MNDHSFTQVAVRPRAEGLPGPEAPPSQAEGSRGHDEGGGLLPGARHASMLGRDALVWVGIEKGYYKEAGFNVKVELGAGADANMTKMTGGQAQFGSMDMTAVMVAAGTGKFKGIKGIGTIHQQTLVSIVAPQDGTVKSPKDLEGKTIGMPQATVNQMLFPAYAKLAGIDTTKVTVQNVPATGIAQALQSNSVAAVSTFLISVGGLENAIANAREYASEFVRMIQPAQKEAAVHG